jgi:hypothetical protein
MGKRCLQLHGKNMVASAAEANIPAQRIFVEDREFLTFIMVVPFIIWINLWGESPWWVATY